MIVTLCAGVDFPVCAFCTKNCKESKILPVLWDLRQHTVTSYFLLSFSSSIIPHIWCSCVNVVDKSYYPLFTWEWIWQLFKPPNLLVTCIVCFNHKAAQSEGCFRVHCWFAKMKLKNVTQCIFLFSLKNIRTKLYYHILLYIYLIILLIVCG